MDKGDDKRCAGMARFGVLSAGIESHRDGAQLHTTGVNICSSYLGLSCAVGEKLACVIVNFPRPARPVLRRRLPCYGAYQSNPPVDERRTTFSIIPCIRKIHAWMMWFLRSHWPALKMQWHVDHIELASEHEPWGRRRLLLPKVLYQSPGIPPVRGSES